MLFREEARDIDRKVDEEVGDMITEVKLMSVERESDKYESDREE